MSRIVLHAILCESLNLIKQYYDNSSSFFLIYITIIIIITVLRLGLEVYICKVRHLPLSYIPHPLLRVILYRYLDKYGCVNKINKVKNYNFTK